MQDTAYFLHLPGGLWEALWRSHRPRGILTVSVNLGGVSPMVDRPGDLFVSLTPATASSSERVWAVADQINRRFGKETTRYGENRPCPSFSSGGDKRSNRA